MPIDPKASRSPKCARRGRAHLWVTALFAVLVAPSTRAAGPLPAPPGWRILYNVNGDHLFHVVPTLTAMAGAHIAGGRAPFPTRAAESAGQVNINYCSSLSTPYPLLSATDALATSSSSSYLAVIQGQLSSDTNIPLEITNQAGSTGGGAAPSLTTPYGGIDIVQTTQASGGTNYSSPYLRMCAQEASGAVCWSAQVLGGTGSSPPNILNWTTNQATGNFTMQVPSAMNFAAGDATNGGQLTIGSTPATATDVTADLITITGADTNSNSTSAHAGPLQLFPGALNNSSPSGSASALEGLLEVGETVKGTGMIAAGTLACYNSSSTVNNASQTAEECEDITSPLLGVFASIGNTGGSYLVLTPPSRVTADSDSSGQVWKANTPVCRDPSSPSLSKIESPIGPCPMGQAVGVAVGDPNPNPMSSHLVDLDFSDQGVVSSGSTTIYATAASTLTTASSGTLACADGSGNVTASNSVCGTPTLGIPSTTQGSITLAPNGPATPTTDGQIEYDNSQVRFAAGSNGITTSFPKVLLAAVPTSDCLSSNTASGCTKIGTTETAFATTATIPAGELTTNKVLRVNIGLYTTETGTGTTVTVKLRATSASGTILLQFAVSGTLSGNKNGMATILIGGTTTPGSSVNINTSGFANYGGGNLGAATSEPITGINTSGGIALVPTAAFGGTTATSTISIMSMTVEALN